jgi:hypothetical protein
MSTILIYYNAIRFQCGAGLNAAKETLVGLGRSSETILLGPG